MHFGTHEIIAMVIGASFAAGLNVYATVATLGLIARAGWVDLPPALDSLENWWVIAVALAMFAIEFVADKIPAFDMIWNALHTFIRVPVAALIAYNATAQLSPAAQMLSAALGGARNAADSQVPPTQAPTRTRTSNLRIDHFSARMTY